MTQFDWLEWAVVLLGIGLFILGGLLMQVLGETERQKQYVDTHAHQLKRLTGLVRHLETQNKELLGQKSEAVSRMGHLRICRTGTNLPSKGCVTWRKSACGI